ncbi:putative acyltransferase [Photobacterium damselae subsp. piscicida]|uniref:Protein ElaA n=1 Tax=Photobacterium damsela subsp. piscicida TaxID=38294 RepID=L7NKE9_PHODP|nr:GNAT family N-acetyltransferase [Photobacterium damselae]AEW29008.1 acetyltransferase [Photobacterium damselae subsp. piscicida]MBE8130476.1 GNAT family N-acetyltransferase [Photobacterium damselae subsp. piscicida]MDP2515777.1 GNAT family N-acetyltransferase [Photobacterium damselae subsp. piscicida]MDP2531817.1 GNAT family N-acetyltransferase [Photobacterium damselae subsp. piscicida]MDP2544771.1 GNAT family N-acetyltransferase [Photobacterium damselae subsp. piscicida]
MTQWQLLQFSQLTTHQLYELLRLRVDVFVVEQTCPYPELDGKDTLEDVYHLLGYQEQKLVACARLLAPTISYSGSSIGRVALAQSARGQGLGHQLIQQAIEHCYRLWPQHSIEIGAQHYLQDFYQQHGFSPFSEVYLEDDIPHLDMRHSLRAPQAK